MCAKCDFQQFAGQTPMTVKGLDHCTILAADLAAARDFYVDVLGLTEGARPPFDFPGHWLYCESHPVIHLVGGERARGASSGSAAVDHVAFAAGDIDRVRDHLRARSVEFQERESPRLGQHQIFLHDPNGIKIELNFPLP